ncbi:MAG: HAMP domain-containing histidine kinase [Oscillospiraceae bacterium]|jgi:signal transduction histidine kinase|nr:HAMP domain-containing histidine kinase [Oscillospiraceae bacterium]
MSAPQRGGHPNKRYFPIWVLLVLAAFAGCFTLGYLLAVRTFGLVGSAAHLTSGLLGFVIFVAVASLFKLCTELYERRHPGKLNSRTHFTDTFLKSTMDAMDRIASGDFNILIPVDEHDPLGELSESINRMARELGSVEQLRQEFVSNVSHEIQSPLTSISGFAALLKNPDLSPELRAHYVEIIETESRRLSKLSDNLLKLSALDAGAVPMNRTAFRLDRQLENAVLTLEPQWSAKRLDLALNLEKVTFEGDEELLTQVWINLLHNAIKFTPDGGKIGVTLTADAGSVRVTVADSGIGIAEQDRIHLFERFYKSDKSRDRSLGGNGLGLSLVKKIAELHGGRVEVESELGEGARFTVAMTITVNS